MNTLTEKEQALIKGTPRGTLFLLLVFMVVFMMGWLGMYFLMFLKHGPIS